MLEVPTKVPTLGISDRITRVMDQLTEAIWWSEELITKITTESTISTDEALAPAILLAPTNREGSMAVVPLMAVVALMAVITN
jgi:hypothetical protein